MASLFRFKHPKIKLIHIRDVGSAENNLFNIHANEIFSKGNFSKSVTQSPLIARNIVFQARRTISESGSLFHTFETAECETFRAIPKPLDSNPFPQIVIKASRSRHEIVTNTDYSPA